MEYAQDDKRNMTKMELNFLFFPISDFATSTDFDYLYNGGVRSPSY